MGIFMFWKNHIFNYCEGDVKITKKTINLKI